MYVCSAAVRAEVFDVGFRVVRAEELTEALVWAHVALIACGWEQVNDYDSRFDCIELQVIGDFGLLHYSTSCLHN